MIGERRAAEAIGLGKLACGPMPVLLIPYTRAVLVKRGERWKLGGDVVFDTAIRCVEATRAMFSHDVCNRIDLLASGEHVEQTHAPDETRGRLDTTLD